MLNRVSALWLLLAVFAGYAASGSSVKADEEPRRLPWVVKSGETVTLVFAHGTLASDVSSIQCKVVNEIRSWVLCGSTDDFSPSGQQRWYDLTRVAEVIRTEK